MIVIGPIEETHAKDSKGTSYGNESFIPLPSGGRICFPAYPEAVSYVRVVDDDGRELMYWNSEELCEDMETSSNSAMGAFLGLAKQVAEAKAIKKVKA